MGNLEKEFTGVDDNRPKPNCCYAKEQGYGEIGCVFPACHCGLPIKQEEPKKETPFTFVIKNRMYTLQMDNFKKILQKDNGLDDDYICKDIEGKITSVCSIKKSIELTVDVAVRFAEWLEKERYVRFDIFENQSTQTHYKYQKWDKSYKDSFEIIESETKTTQELFGNFINNYYE